MNTTAAEDVLILAIESSCDETAASVVKNGRTVLSNVISSQIATRPRYMEGVVPEIASREHIKAISVIERALSNERDSWGYYYGDRCYLWTRTGGGIIGRRGRGQAIAYAAHKPLISVHHIEGHVSANFIENPDLGHRLCVLSFQVIPIW